MRGFAELELFARPIIKVNYSTRDPKTASGKTVTIDISDPPVKGTFLIQSVSIDQIHDEADMLTPRYNVSASSVKFELTDLLLQILADTNQSSGGNGGSNLTGIQSVQPATPAVMDWIADPTVAWLPSGTNTVNGIGIVSGTVAGTTSAAGRSDGFYLNFTPTGTTINTTSSLTTTINQASSDYDWTWECVLVIPSANQDGSGASIGAIGSALRIYAGACTAIVPDSDGTTRRAIFRFAPSFGDPGWVGITADGSNRTVSARVAPIAYDTRYLLKIRSVNTVGTPTVFFSVNGGVEVANTATIPVNAVSQTPFGLFSVVIVNAVGGTGSNPSFSWKVAQLKRGASSR
jgi:hypothetical protein